MDTKHLSQQHIELIQKAKKIALFAHENPDGDAYGSSLAMKKILQNMGKDVRLFLPDVSDVYSFLPKFDNIETSFDYGEYDLLITLDCGDIKRLGKFYHDNSCYFDDQYADKTLVIDHHVGKEGGFPVKNEMLLQYSFYSSTCELVYDLFSPHYLEYFDAELATYFLLGIYTDTGKFKYGEHPENSFRVASELMKMGADRNLIVNEYLQGRGFNEVKFAAWMINHAQQYENILYTSYEKKDLDIFAIDIERATLALNILQTIKWNGVILVVRYIDGKLKFSMRSRCEVNVGKVANALGGGGHKNAAGFSVQIGEVENYHAEIEHVLEKITELL